MPHEAGQRNAYTDRTPADTLALIVTDTDRLSITRNGDLRIEGVQAIDLTQEHGSPLYVVSEDTLRTNFRGAPERLCRTGAHLG
jgi:hypothetical protein